MDESEIEDARQAIYEGPDFNSPVDVYYKRQEDLQEILSNAKVNIPNSELFHAFAKHAAATGMFNQPYTKWTRKTPADKNWSTAKKFFRTALANKKAIDKITTGESNFGANTVDMRDEMQDLVGTAMDNLTLAAVTKQTTLDLLIQTNATLVKANADQ